MLFPPEAPHTSPEYLAEDRGKGQRVGIFVVLSIAYSVLALRFYARYLTRNAGLDDYLMGAATALSVGTNTLGIIVIDLGAGKHVTAIPRAQLVRLYKHLVALQLIYHITLWVCRISGIAFYSRLCTNAGRSSLYMWMAFAFVTAVALAHSLILALQCIPLESLWRDQPGRCLTQYAVYISTAAMTIVCDTVVLLIPLRIIWGLKINRRRKFALGLVLLMGAFAVITSVIRIIKMMPAVITNDSTWYLSTVIFWSIIEMSTAMVALSAPALKPLLGKWMTDNPQVNRGHRGFDGPQNPRRGMSTYTAESFRSAKQASMVRTTVHGSVENLDEEDLCADPAVCSGIRKTVEVQVTTR